MARKATVYKGKKISVVEVHGRKHLFIDEEYIPTKARRTAGPFWSAHLPYQHFDDLREMGKAIVDYRDLDKRKRRSRGELASPRRG